MYRVSKSEPKELEAAISFRDYLFDHGPKSAQELSKELVLPLAFVYRAFSVGKEHGLIHPVAHVHRGHNSRMPVWDIVPRSEAERFYREAKLIGRFCQCIPTGSRPIRQRKWFNDGPSEVPGAERKRTSLTVVRSALPPLASGAGRARRAASLYSVSEKYHKWKHSENEIQEV